MSVEDWAEIRRLHQAEGLPIKTIARTVGISRNTVRAAQSVPTALWFQPGAICRFKRIDTGASTPLLSGSVDPGSSSESRPWPHGLPALRKELRRTRS
jgi:hypothetical protein